MAEMHLYCNGVVQKQNDSNMKSRKEYVVPRMISLISCSLYFPGYTVQFVVLPTVSLSRASESLLPKRVTTLSLANKVQTPEEKVEDLNQFPEMTSRNLCL